MKRPPRLRAPGQKKSLKVGVGKASIPYVGWATVESTSSPPKAPPHKQIHDRRRLPTVPDNGPPGTTGRSKER
jgi:hypothetical protein